MNRAFPFLLLAAASAVPAAAQPAPARAAAARAVDAQAVVAEVRRIIAAQYVLPEKRPALDAVLAEGLSSGRYRTSDPTQLAARINADLERVGRDGHLNFKFDPRQSEMIGAARNAAAPDVSGFERMVRSRNHGIFGMKLLPGNVRYLDYRNFDWIGPDSAAALDTALQFLAGGDAIIIDLRENGGGSPEAVQYLVSHFMEAGRPLVTFHMNGVPSPDTLSTLAELRVPRMVGKPLYVLTSRGSASAAEEFIGHVGGYRLGELVGENSAGAGFRNELVAIDGGFVLSVSVGRAVLASTGRDWEAVGIAPTIPTAVSGALEVAQAHALRRLAAAAPAPRRAQLEAAAQAVQAMAEPGTPAAAPDAYAGTYGERTVSVEDGKLMYRLAQRPARRLVPLGGHLFAFADDPMQRVTFVPAGTGIAAMEVGIAAGPVQGRYERSR